MSIKINLPNNFDMKPRITVFGVGGAGCNAVNNMISAKLEGVEFWVANTDAQALKHSLCENRIQLGTDLTQGLGAGALPEVGKNAAQESIEDIANVLEDTNMVFITAGMGGGTGTGAAPVIAKIAKDKGILTVGVVTKPFHFEGARRMKIAELGLEELNKYLDTLIVIPNQNLFRIANENTTFAESFKIADNVLHSGVRGITDLITMPGLINLDFADIKAVMSEMGKAMMGTGEGEGENRAIIAAEAALSNPLLDTANISTKGAKGVIINITGGMDMTLYEVDAAATRIREEVDPDANIIFGSAFNPELEKKIRVSVVVTGIDAKNPNEERKSFLNDSLNLMAKNEQMKVNDNNSDSKLNSEEEIASDDGESFIAPRAVEPTLYSTNEPLSSNPIFKSFEEHVDELDSKNLSQSNDNDSDDTESTDEAPDEKALAESKIKKSVKENFFDFDVPAFIRKRMGRS